MSSLWIDPGECIVPCPGCGQEYDYRYECDICEHNADDDFDAPDDEEDDHG